MRADAVKNIMFHTARTAIGKRAAHASSSDRQGVDNGKVLLWMTYGC